jgi:hypothetical protein
MSDMPSLFFNEYFKRKPDRLSEREQVNLFTMEPSEQNCVEYVFAEPLRQEIQKLKADREVLVEMGKFYANKANWSQNMGMLIYSNAPKPNLYKDLDEKDFIGGERARQAIESIGEIE